MFQRAISILAQHDPGYQWGVLFMHIGSVLTFVGLLVVGIGIFVTKPKAGEKSLSPKVTRAVGVMVIILALVAAAFMW